MGMERRRRGRRGRIRIRWPGPVLREAWGSLLLAGASLLLGAFVQDPVRYGWLAPTAAGMLLVRVGITFEPPVPEPRREPAVWPAAPVWTYLAGAAGLAAAVGAHWLLSGALLTSLWVGAALLLLLAGRNPSHYPLRLSGALILLLAAGRAVGVESFPDPMSTPHTLQVGELFLTARMLRQINFAAVVIGGLAAVWAYRSLEAERAVQRWVALLTHLTSLWLITYEIADAIPMTRGAASAGNEVLWIATAWGLYGLMLVLTAPWAPQDLSWLELGQAVLVFALGFLLMAGMLANARWADAPVRFAAYAGVPGATLLAAWVQERRGRLTDPDRLLALAAAGMLFGICSFEVLRWMEPQMTYPKEVQVTPAILARDHDRLTGITIGVWLLYCGLLLLAGRLLRSPLVRFMGITLLLSTLLYALFWLVL
ncbi:MAG: hypothetical protein ACOY93_22190 [Bacillota bacterium]